MDCGKEFGCYGFRKDLYWVPMPPQPANSIIDYGIILIDNVGDYRILKGQCRVIT